MSDAALAEIRAHLDKELRLGFADFDTVVENAQELHNDDDGYPGDEVVESAAEEVLTALLAEQTSWTRPTDAERLDVAFKVLNEEGILARHCYAPTRSWAAGDLENEAVGARQNGLNVRGFAFYTSQDAEQLLDGSLNIAWSPEVQHGQTYAQHLGEARRVGETIVKALTDAGLDVVWDGAVGTTIRVQNLTWRHLRDATTMAPTLSTKTEYFPSSNAPENPSESKLSSLLASTGEWHVRIALMSNLSDAGPQLFLHHLTDLLRVDFIGHATPLDEFDPEQTYALDYCIPEAKLRGRAVRLDLIAAPTSIFFGLSRRAVAELADVVVFVPADEEALDSMLERTPIEGRTMVILLDTLRWPDPEVVARLQAKHGDVVCQLNLKTGEGIRAANSFLTRKGVRGLAKRAARLE